jgi:hypothetical protein
MHTRTKIATVVLTVVALAGASATAYAASDDKTADLNGPTSVSAGPSTDKVGPQAALKAKRFAVVDRNGTLNRGKNTISAAQVGTGGSYEVFFDRDVTHCAYVATIGTLAAGTETPGIITVASRAGQPTGVFVDTSNVDGTDGLRSFHLEVIC